MTVYVRFDQTAKTLGTQGVFGIARNGFSTDLSTWGEIYVPIDSRTGNNGIYWNRMDALGVDSNSKIGFTLWADQLQYLLPTWIEDDTNRRASINTRADDSGMWDVLDAMVYVGGKGIYFRLFHVPNSICGETDPWDIWESQYRVLEELYNGGWTMMGKFQRFAVDIMTLCYNRYGSSVCNNWLWSVCNEVWPESYTNTSVPTESAFAIAICELAWAITAVWKQNYPSCKTVAIEQVGWGTYHLVDTLAHLNTVRPSENFLKYIDYISFHSYGSGGSSPATDDEILDGAVTFNTTQLDQVKNLVTSLLSYYGEPSSIGIVHGESGIGNIDDTNPVRNMSYLSGVWKTLILTSAAYNDVKQIINWGDWGNAWGFWDADNGFDKTGYYEPDMFPNYYAQVALHEWARLDSGDVYAVVNSDGGTSVAAPMNSIDQDITVYALKLANSKNRDILLWNRSGSSQNVSITAKLDSEYASNSDVLVQKFVMNSSNANGTLSHSIATASSSNVSLSVSMAAYEFCMLRISRGFGGSWGGI